MLFLMCSPHALQDAAPGTPIFVFLSPGVDVAASVEGLGRKLGFTADTGHYSAVSLGQGQEPIAMNNLTNAHKNGGWVLLQNIHLTIDWTSGPLEKKVDKLTEGAHKDFRCVSDFATVSGDQGHDVNVLSQSLLPTTKHGHFVKLSTLPCQKIPQMAIF